MRGALAKRARIARPGTDDTHSCGKSRRGSAHTRRAAVSHLTTTRAGTWGDA